MIFEGSKKFKNTPNDYQDTARRDHLSNFHGAMENFQVEIGKRVVDRQDRPCAVKCIFRTWLELPRDGYCGVPDRYQVLYYFLLVLCRDSIPKPLPNSQHVLNAKDFRGDDMQSNVAQFLKLPVPSIYKNYYNINIQVAEYELSSAHRHDFSAGLTRPPIARTVTRKPFSCYSYFLLSSNSIPVTKAGGRHTR